MVKATNKIVRVEVLGVQEALAYFSFCNKPTTGTGWGVARQSWLDELNFIVRLLYNDMY